MGLLLVFCLTQYLACSGTVLGRILQAWSDNKYSDIWTKPDIHVRTGTHQGIYDCLMI